MFEEYKKYTVLIRIFESRNLSDIEYFLVLRRKFSGCYSQVEIWKNVYMNVT